MKLKQMTCTKIFIGKNLFDFSNQVIGKIKDEVKEFLLMSFLD